MYVGAIVKASGMLRLKAKQSYHVSSSLLHVLSALEDLSLHSLKPQFKFNSN